MGILGGADRRCWHSDLAGGIDGHGMTKGDSMAHKSKAPSTVVPGTELGYIISMLKVASEYHLEAEVVLELCNTLRQAPDTRIDRAAFDALSEWDL